MIDEAQVNQQTFAHAETICQKKRTRVPARRNAAVQGHTAPGPPSPFRANETLRSRIGACSNRVAQTCNRDRGVDRRWVVRHDGIGANRIKLSRPPKTARPTPLLRTRRPFEGRPMDPFGVKVARGGGSIAKTPQRPTHPARWAFQSQTSVGSMTASSPTDEYPGMV